MTRRALSRRVILLTWVDFAVSWARLIGDSGCEILSFCSFLTIQMCSNQFCLQEFIFSFGLTKGEPQDIDIYQRNCILGPTLRLAKIKKS